MALVSIVVVILAGTTYYLVWPGGSSRSTMPADVANTLRVTELQRSRHAWTQMVRSGTREARIHQLPTRWPFASLKSVSGGMPMRLRRQTMQLLQGGETLRLRFGQAAYVRTAAGRLWVVLGRNVLCVIRGRKVTLSCGTTAAAYREGILLEFYKPGKRSGSGPTRFTALGLMPNGVKQVRVGIGARRRRLPVVRNTFFISAKQPIRLAPIRAKH